MKALVNKKYVLEKFDGKGGWTYVLIPEMDKHKKKAFGLVKVRGTIDGYEFRKHHLMPMKERGLFLPVNAVIRKAIGKGPGDKVHVVLYADDEPLDVPDEMLLCLQDEPVALKFFNGLSESERLFYIKWVYSAKKDETKVARLAKTIDRLARGLKMYDKDFL